MSKRKREKALDLDRVGKVRKRGRKTVGKIDGIYVRD